MEWDYKTVWSDFGADRAESISAVYGEVLSKGPVARLEKDIGEGFWGIFSYQDVINTASDTRTFSSETPLRGARVLPLQADPPEHGAVRRVLNPYFAPSRIRELEAGVRPIAAAMIDGVLANGNADFAEAMTLPFPVRVLCKLMAVPDEDWHFHLAWATDIDRQNPSGLLKSNEEPIPMEMLGGFFPYMEKLVAQRRAAPGDDVISGIIRAETRSPKFSDQAVIGLFMALMLGGHHTTSAALSTFILRLAREPGLQSLLRAQPARIPEAIEESLRIDTPQQAMPRRCTRDAEIAGQKISAGDYLLLQFGSANVDPAHWHAPDEFDLARNNKGHLAFGHGIHRCVGASLARMEIRVVTEELLARTKSFSVGGEIRRTAWPRLMVTHMPLSFELVRA